MTASPKTAILLAYYQYPDGLLRTLKSLCGEKEDFTLYIIDDGSIPVLDIDTDEYPYPIVLLRHAVNQGVEHASNTGLRQILADGFDFIAKLDTADSWVPGRLAAQRDFLLSHPHHVVVGARAEALDEEQHQRFILSYPEDDAGIRRFMYLNSAFCNPAVMMRADAVRRVGFYSADYPAAEDYEYLWRLLDFGKGANLPQIWVRYEVTRLRPSISWRRRKEQLRSRLRLQRQRFNPVEPFAWWGLLRTFLLICTPYELIVRVKSLLWR